MTLFPKIPEWESQNWDSYCLENLDAHTFFKSYLFGTYKISYNPQKDLSSGVLHAPIRGHLTPALKRFVVRNQIPNLTLSPSFDHNSCI